MRRMVTVLALLTVTRAAMAQDTVQGPPRPTLDWSDPDTNDARSYIHYAEQHVLDSWPAAWWAVRLDPVNVRARQLYFIALFIHNRKAFARVVDDADLQKKIVEIGLDTTLTHLMQLDPFVSGQMSPQRVTRERAYLAKHPGSVGTRINLASDLFVQGDHQGAIAVVKEAIAVLQDSQAKVTRPAYQSLEMFNYAIGRAWLADGNPNEAQQAFARALEENLGFSMAHAAMGEAAYLNADTATATREYGEAVEINGTDVTLRYNYGTALLQADRFEEAITQFQKAIALDPDFARSYYNLAVAMETIGHAGDAVAAYGRFLARAPRTMRQEIDRARQHQAALADLLKAAKGPDNR